MLNWTGRQRDRVVIRERGTGGTGGQDGQEGHGERGTGLRVGQVERIALLFPAIYSQSAPVVTKLNNNQYRVSTRLEPKLPKSAAKYKNTDRRSVSPLSEVGFIGTWLSLRNMQLLRSYMYRTVPNWLLCNIQLLNSTMYSTVPNWLLCNVQLLNSYMYRTVPNCLLCNM